MAKLFGDDLARETLWGKIGSAIQTSLAKVSDDDMDRFASLCLEHIQADEVMVAACEPLAQMLQSWQARTREFRQAVLHYLKAHRMAVLVHARTRWEQVKSKEIEL